MTDYSIVANTRVLSSHTTGVQRYLQELLNHWRGPVDIISPGRPLDGVWGHAWEQMVLPRGLGGNLLWSPSNTGPLAVRKQVVTIHDMVSMDHPEFLNPRFAAWYQFLLPRLVNKVRRVIVVSEFTKERLMKTCNIGEDRISVIWNGVDKRFCPRPLEEISSAREQLGIPTGRYLVALGSLEPRKNLKRLLDAWSRIVGVMPEDVCLVVAGAMGKSIVFDGLSFDPLPPRVHLTGHVPDELLPALYAGALAAPYLSVYEGFGLPPLEAMACGTPTLTSNRTALPEVVGDAAMMVDPYDVDAIGDGLRRLVEDGELRDSLRKRGFNRASLFDWKHTAERTWQVLQQTAEEG